MSITLLCLMSALPALQAPAASSALNPESILDAARAKAKAVMAARSAHIKAGKNTKDFRGDCAQELAQIDAQLNAEQRPEARQALLVSRLFHLQLAKMEPAPTFLAQIQKEVPPTAPAWSLDPSLIMALADEEAPGWGSYVLSARDKHPDAAIRRNLLFEYFWDRLSAKAESAWKPVFETLQTAYPDSREAKQAKVILEGERKTGIGRPAPAFHLKALGDPKTIYSLDQFMGRYLLLDFWATWCPPCRAEMPNLHAAWAKFKGKPFDILSLSFDRQIEHIAPFRRQAATPMPWKHAFIQGGFKHPLADAYGVQGIPKPLLIGPDGKIVAGGTELTGKNLEVTLKKFLGD